MAPLVVIAERDIDVQLRAAADRGDLAVFRTLIAAGADVNARDAQKDSDRDGVNALQHAQRRGQEEVARMLRAAGAWL